MIEVTKEQFFKALYADKRDIMPSTEYTDRTVWRTKGGVKFGETYPGWKNSGDLKRYFLMVQSTALEEAKESP